MVQLFFFILSLGLEQVYCFRCQKNEAALNEMSLKTYFYLEVIGAIIGLTIGVNPFNVLQFMCE